MHIFCLCWTIFLHSITLLSFLLSSSSFEAIQKKHFSCRVITHTLRTPRHAACKAVAKAQWQFCYCYYFRKVAREGHRVLKSIKKSRFYNIVGEANYVYLQSFKVSCKSTGVILTGFGAKFKHFQTACFVGEHLGNRDTSRYLVGVPKKHAWKSYFKLQRGLRFKSKAWQRSSRGFSMSRL